MTSFSLIQSQRRDVKFIQAIMTQRTQYLQFLILVTLGLSAMLVTACSRQDGMSAAPVSTQLSGELSSITPSPTAFQPVHATATPEMISLWISPAVPRALRQPLEDLIQKDATLVLTGDQTNPDVRVEQSPDLPLTEWVYAFVAPFPTVQDGGSLDGLRQVWTSGGESWVGMYASPSTTAAMDGILGPSSGEIPIMLSDEDLLEAAWSAQLSFAIVPFEDLEPRWKVLDIDGGSPIHKDFIASSYPLVVWFGLSGDPAKVAVLQDTLNWPSTNRDPNRMTVLVMTGTTALVRATAWQMEENGITFPGELIGHWLREADLAHISSEVPVSEDCPKPNPTQVDLLFCSDPKYLALFGEIGVDLIELTGNHVMDWGPEALLYTLEQYRQNDWSYYGGGENLAEAIQPLRIEHNGNKLAFLGCNMVGPRYAWATLDTPGAAPCDTEGFFEEVQNLRTEGYLPIFTFQWEELSYTPPAQIITFRETIDAGALIVNGSQAHQPKMFEFYGEGFIHYGLGNLFFDQMQSLEHRQEFLDRHVFYDGQHISTELLTAMLENYAQPRPMTAEERASLLVRIFSASGFQAPEN